MLGCTLSFTPDNDNTKENSLVLVGWEPDRESNHNQIKRCLLKKVLDIFCESLTLIYAKYTQKLLREVHLINMVKTVIYWLSIANMNGSI